MRVRDKYADCLKGYACFLVVFGHVIMGIRNSGADVPMFGEWLEKFIWTFHVALFMFLSGYIYEITGTWQSKGSRIKFILHKLLNLGVPYVVCSAIYITINSLIAGVNNQSNITDILWIWKTSTAQYWFLYALFGIFVIYTVLSGAMENWQIAIVLLLSEYLAPAFGVTFGSFRACVTTGFIFGLGTMKSRLPVEKQRKFVKFGLIAVHIVLTAFLINRGWSSLPVIDHMEQILGIMASMAFVSLILYSRMVEKILLFLCRYSFPIYLLHTIFTAGMRIILNKAGIENYGIHIIIGLLTGIMIPFGGAWITDKIPLVDFFIYPSKNIKRLRKG